MIDLIKRVSEKASVSQSVAEKTFDVVITEVKSKLPKEMADDLVKVLAGEMEFQDSSDGSPKVAHDGYNRLKQSSLQGWEKLKSTVKNKIAKNESSD